MLHQDIKLLGLLGLKIEAKFHLYWKQSMKRVACLNIPRHFNVIIGQNLKTK